MSYRRDYNLSPTREVATFIKANHYPPDISPADEVKEKGLSLGEMQWSHKCGADLHGPIAKRGGSVTLIGRVGREAHGPGTMVARACR
jgi:hypothetical protein